MNNFFRAPRWLVAVGAFLLASTLSCSPSNREIILDRYRSAYSDARYISPACSADCHSDSCFAEEIRKHEYACIDTFLRDLTHMPAPHYCVTVDSVFIKDILNGGDCKSMFVVGVRGQDYLFNLIKPQKAVAYDYPFMRAVMSLHPVSFTFFYVTETHRRPDSPDVIFSVYLSDGQTRYFDLSAPPGMVDYEPEARIVRGDACPAGARPERQESEGFQHAESGGSGRRYGSAAEMYEDICSGDCDSNPCKEAAYRKHNLVDKGGKDTFDRLKRGRPRTYLAADIFPFLKPSCKDGWVVEVHDGLDIKMRQPGNKFLQTRMFPITLFQWLFPNEQACEGVKIDFYDGFDSAKQEHHKLFEVVRNGVSEYFDLSAPPIR